MTGICSCLLSLTIVGATEVAPEIMYIQYMDYSTNRIEELYVDTNEYTSCFADGVPV